MTSKVSVKLDSLFPPDHPKSMSLILAGGSGFHFGMSGRTYHRIFPTSRPNHPAHWFLHDPSAGDVNANAHRLPLPIVENIRQDLLEFNPLFQIYQSFAAFEPTTPNAYLELADPGTGNEIAALLHVGNAPRPTSRQVYVMRTNPNPDPTKPDRASRISILHPLYEPLQYPILFPHGTFGWGGKNPRTCNMTQIQYYKQRLLCEPRFQQLGRVGNEYMCDMYSRVEDERLDFIRKSKKKEADLFRDPCHEFDEDDDGEDFNLPASFTGSQRYYSERVADALALARQRGKPDLMITATCNPKWPELASQLLPGQSAMEVAHITNRVFKVSTSAPKKVIISLSV